MSGTTPRRDYFTAGDLARFCKVDRKTVHTWVDRGLISASRTGGRHRRFARADVVAFLRAPRYPLPPELQGDAVELSLALEVERLREALRDVLAVCRDREGQAVQIARKALGV